MTVGRSRLDAGTPTRARHPLRALGFLDLLVALAWPWPASAQQAPRLTVIGAGAGVTCAEWVAAGRSDPELEQWAFGFASAVAAGRSFVGAATRWRAWTPTRSTPGSATTAGAGRTIP